MYLDPLPLNPLTTTKVRIKYDCECGKEHILKWKDADKNFQKNNGKHICRICFLKTNNPAKKEETKEKTRQTNLERYGCTTVLNSVDNIAKRKKQYEDPEFVKARAEAHKKTCIERYGVEHHMHTNELKEKIKNTNLERYGVVAPLQNPAILTKAQATNLEKYGDVCSLNNPEVRAKALKSLFEHYGVEYYNQLPEMREYLKENCPKWMIDAYANPWAKGITRPVEWIDKQRQTVEKLILEGKWLTGHKNTWRGYYNGEKCKREISFFRSGFELMYHYYLDNNDYVEWYDYESFGIKYKKLDGSNGTYYPDFIIKFVDDPILHIREVKANYLHDSEETKLKYFTAIDYISKFENMDFGILLKEEIYALKVDFEELIKNEKVIILHNPRENKNE